VSRGGAERLFEAVRITRARAQRRREAGHLEVARELDLLARELRAAADREVTANLRSTRCPNCGALVPLPRLAQ